MTLLLSAEWFHGLAGLLLGTMAVRAARDPAQEKRAGTAAFWALLGGCFVLGPWVPAEWVGLAVVIMVALAATQQVRWPPRREERSAERAASAERLGNRLLWPTAVIPIVVVLGGLTLGRINGATWQMVLPWQVNQVALGLGCVVCLVAAIRLTGARSGEAFGEGGRLLQLIGWALILPQMLAALGGIFAAAGVGEVVADLVARVIPTQHPLVAVMAYCVAMPLFTIIMGNAFAAFPVITLGIGLPFIVDGHGGNPAIMGAIGMLSGYCGTLVTPMAANFNLVPAMLLELEDRNAVIKAQAPFAAALWVFNVVAMALLVYRF